MISQDNITAATPMGANLIGAHGATFRVWAPRASAVNLLGNFGGVDQWTQTQQNLMLKHTDGYWTGYVDSAHDGDQYKFYVIGTGAGEDGQGYKRDPYARELTANPAYPHCNCVIRKNDDYVWQAESYQTPDYSNIIIYQLHIGVYTAAYSPGRINNFLDVVEKIEYLVDLGVNAIQPMPIDECNTNPGLGYNGTDYFSPDTPFTVSPADLPNYLPTINRLFAAKGKLTVTAAQIESAPNQLKVLVDLCHLYGIAVIFDVVYNHAGGFNGDRESLFFWDLAPTGDNNNSLYFTDRGWAGGLTFAFWNRDVRQFIINNAIYYINQFRIDGLRYDEISVLCNLNGGEGWRFCQDLTSTLRFIKPRLMQNAEFWSVNPNVVRSSNQGGAGFDVTQHDGLRISIRNAIRQSSFGASAPVSMQAILDQLSPPFFDYAWQAVTCVENHDIVKTNADQRLPALADDNDHHSWYARSRSRVATGILLTAPGIPQLFMGQEFLEDKQWSENPSSANLIYWQGLDTDNKVMVDHLRFTRELIHLRWQLPALRSNSVRGFLADDFNRVLAFHRWIEGSGQDVVVVVSLNDKTFYGYSIGFPKPGVWQEVFDSDVYDNWVNPIVSGNGGSIVANGNGMHGFNTSSNIVLPANSILVFAYNTYA